MQTSSLDRIKEIWTQQKIPVIYRKGAGHPLLVRLPYKDDNRIWLRNYRRTKPDWDNEKRHWEIPKAWFNDTVDRSLRRWGQVYIIQPHHEHEKCAPACWNATGHECQCSCLGANHGSQQNGGGWFVASDTFAVKWHASELACRLLTRTK